MLFQLHVFCCAFAAPPAGLQIRARAPRLCSTAPEQPFLSISSLKGALSRVGGGTIIGAAGGAAAHAALNSYTALGAAQYALADPLLNVADIFLGGASGVVLGGLWACQASLVASGALGGYLRGAIGSLVDEDADARAGEKALATIRESITTLTKRGGWPIRLAFFVSGLGEEPAIAKLVDEAQATRQGSAKPFSEIVVLAFESTLEARLDDAKFLVLSVALFAGGVANGAVWLLGASLSAILGGG